MKNISMQIKTRGQKVRGENIGKVGKGTGRGRMKEANFSSITEKDDKGNNPTSDWERDYDISISKGLEGNNSLL